MLNNYIELAFDAAMIALFIFASIDDVKTRIVRPKYQLTALGISLVHLAFVFGHYGWRQGLMYLSTGAIMFTIYIVMFLIFKSGIGGADTKMTSILALYLGLWPAVVMIFVHGIAGVVYSAYMSIVHHKHIKSVPLMLFLLIGMCGALIVKWLIILI